jgi:hypothetical protein
VNGRKYVQLLEEDIDGDILLSSNCGKNREIDGLTPEIQKICPYSSPLRARGSPTQESGNDTASNQSLAPRVMGSCEYGRTNVRLLLGNDGVL